jgi:purine nucleosidase
MRKRVLLTAASLLLLASCLAWGQGRRKIIIDEDCSGPGGSNLQAPLVLIQSPQAEVLGITVVSGDQWREEEVSHMLRLLEIIGLTDVPVVPGAVFPLIRRRDETLLWEQRYGKVAYAGAWDERWWHEPFVIPTLPEGKPATKPADEDGAHFLVRMVRRYPHQVTIYAGGPMTDLALAIALDSQFPQLAQELIFMGGSLNPRTDDPEFATNPRHEFNFWFDPEAAEIVLRAPWRKIVGTPTDISIKTLLTPAMMLQIKASGRPLANYLARYYQQGLGADYMWDELTAAAWLDPSLITKHELRYMGIDLDRGPGYGNTLTWTVQDQPHPPRQPVEIQQELDPARFYRMFIGLMSAATPRVK